MSRFDDSPELFGVGSGTATCGTIRCGICGTTYNEGADNEECYDDNASVLHTTFAGVEVCECCYEAVEKEVLSRMNSILQWYSRIVTAKEKALQESRKYLNAIIGGNERNE